MKFMNDLTKQAGATNNLGAQIGGQHKTNIGSISDLLGLIILTLVIKSHINHFITYPKISFPSRILN